MSIHHITGAAAAATMALTAFLTTGTARAQPAASTCHSWNWAKGSRNAKAWWWCNSPLNRKIKVRLRCHYPSTTDYVSGPGVIAANVASAAACGTDGSLRTVLVGTKPVGTPTYSWTRVWRW